MCVFRSIGRGSHTLTSFSHFTYFHGTILPLTVPLHRLRRKRGPREDPEGYKCSLQGPIREGRQVNLSPTIFDNSAYLLVLLRFKLENAQQLSYSASVEDYQVSAAYSVADLHTLTHFEQKVSAVSSVLSMVAIGSTDNEVSEDRNCRRSPFTILYRSIF